MPINLQWDAIYWKLTGFELSPRIPALPVAGREYVRFGVAHLDGVGRDVLPAVGNVAYPIGYGTDGVEFTGTLTAGFPPTPPTLTVTDLTGGIARFTITGSTVGASNRVYARLATETSWPASPSAIIIGNGTADVALTPGPYLAKVQSHLLGAVSPAANEPVLFYIGDSAAGYTRSDFGVEFKAEASPELLAAFGEPVTYQRGVQAVELVAIQGEALHSNDPATGLDFVMGDCSWEFDADELDFGAGPIVPKAQDQIITAKGEVYVAVEAGVLDAERLFWTIPVKRSEYKELA